MAISESLLDENEELNGQYSLGLVQCELSGTNLSPSLVACAVALKISAIGNLSPSEMAERLFLIYIKK
ncbi:702_t:CDS:2 [Entrophospora sp. SA101]|nr:702_t:CDS:2 [Entrophospora sp. SA101]